MAKFVLQVKYAQTWSYLRDLALPRKST